MAVKRGGVEWGAGKPRRRTSASNWNLPLKLNAKPFAECANCGWRGDRPAAGAGNQESCPGCGSADLAAARRRVFCSSLADVFDNEVPDQWRWDLFALIKQTPNLDWLLLTKRIGNASRMLNAAASAVQDDFPGASTWDKRPWPNVWIGATIATQAEAERDIPKLFQVPAVIRFVSMEPLLEAVDLTRVQHLKMLDWVIVGGESGSEARPMHPAWPRALRDQCAAAGIPFLFKQHGEWASPNDSGVHNVQVSTKRWLYPSIRISPDGTRYDPASKDLHGGNGWLAKGMESMLKIGKNKSGRMLDGVLHSDFPASPLPPSINVKLSA
jgi:protein gp37